LFYYVQFFGFIEMRFFSDNPVDFGLLRTRRFDLSDFCDIGAVITSVFSIYLQSQFSHVWRAFSFFKIISTRVKFKAIETNSPPKKKIQAKGVSVRSVAVLEF